MDDTLLQFGRMAGSGPRASASATGEARATRCPRCEQHFSPDGRFCPFDGEPLRPAPRWDPNADPLLGTVVDGRYEICSVLGEGGMGVVYEVRHRALGKRFALKALRKDLATDADIAARFTQEARTAAAVSHPGLVEITDFGRLSTGQPFFVMELLEGQSLASLIRRGGPIPAARAIEIVRQIAEALGTAHEHSIVHRDLKPDNIHISPAGPGPERVTIVDFGLAKVIGTSRLTRAGMVFGTPHYMSPEQAMGEATDHRADVYALGIVMYEMFTGRVPFEADSYMGVLTKHMYMAPTPPSQLLATAELGVLEDITLRCLEKKPDHRYATLRELTHDLDVALNAPNGERPSATARQRRAIPRSLLADELELPARAERLPGLARSSRQPPSRWPLVVVGGLFLAGIAGALAWRKAATPPDASAAQVTTASDPLATRAATAETNVTAPLPIVTSSAAAAVTSSAAAAVTSSAAAARTKAAESEAKASAASRVQAEAKAAPKRVQGALPAPSAPVPPAAAPTSKKSARIVSSDIVDPWAK